MVQNLDTKDSTLPSGSHCFQIIGGKVVGYSDTLSDDKDGVRFVVAEAEDPVVYLGRDEADLSRKINYITLAEQDNTAKLRSLAKNAYLDLQFAIDMDDPDIEGKRLSYDNAVANYKASL